MIDPSAQAAPMPGGDPAMLAALLGGGGDPMAGGMPPEMMGPEPGMGMQPAGGNPYPTADPNFMAQMLGQIVEAQQADAAQLQTDQQAALQGNPMFQGLMAGAPMGPGAGQDGAGIDMGGELPVPGV
jgi:hypothetical protein